MAGPAGPIALPGANLTPCRTPPPLTTRITTPGHRTRPTALRGWPEHLRPNGLDIQNLVEEIEQLSRSEEARLTSLLRQLFLQLLKLEFHPSHRSRRHWMREVNAFRVQIQRFGDPRPRRGGPKLWSERHTWAADAWSDAVRQFRADLVSGERGSTLQHLADAQVTADRPRYDLDGTTLDPAWYPAPWPESDRT